MEAAFETARTPSKAKARDPNRLLAKKVWGWYTEARDHSSNFRKESDTDCAYYDNEQWTPDEKRELRERKQPILTINRIKPTVDLVLGTEAKSKVEFMAAPRSEMDIEDASIATEALKYVMDANQGEFICGEGFEASIKAGWGILEVCENDDPFGEKVRLDRVERTDLLWDPHSKQFDLSDSKYIIRAKWLELEDAQGKFPDHADLLERAVSTEESDFQKETPYQGTEDQADRPGVTEWHDSRVSSPEWVDKGRKRVKLLECWYKVPTKVLLVENEMSGDVDEIDPNQIMEILFNPGIRINQAMVSKVMLCIVAGDEILQQGSSPYRDNEYPFVPFWGYRKDKDGAPYGLIRQLRDMQDEINKRRSKAIHLLNSRQILATNDAIDMKQNDWRDVAQKASEPDSVTILDGNAGPNAKFDFVDRDKAIKDQFMFESEAKGEIEEISGVVGELKGMETNATSGKAIMARQMQGTTMLGKLFENYRRSRQILGTLIWSRIQQFWTKPKMVRITDKMGEYAFLELNKYIEDESGQILIQNDITKARVDITIDEQAFHANIRQALLEQMMEMVSKLPPEIGVMLLDLVVEYSDMPKGPEMAGRIKMIQQQMMMNQQQEQANAQRDADIQAQGAMAKAQPRPQKEARAGG